MIEEEQQKFNVSSAPESRPDVIVFKPYEVPPVKTGGPIPPSSSNLIRAESVQGIPLEP
jgi:hypothetical protein